MEDKVCCERCLNYFMMEGVGGGEDRRPIIICSSDHIVCARCAADLKNRRAKCPTCNSELLKETKVDTSCLGVLEKLFKLENIPHKELKLAPKPFAGGAFGDVYDAKWQQRDVAVKAIRLANQFGQYRKMMELEAKLAIGLLHPNVIRLFGTATLKDGRFAIVMEKADKGSLQDHCKTMEKEMLTQVCIGIVEGLQYMHSRKVVHRDLKPANILLHSKDMIPKIADFGLSKVIPTLVKVSGIVGTIVYTAPEIISESIYGLSVDVYSFSIMLYELFTGKEAYPGKSFLQIMQDARNNQRPRITDDVPVRLRTVIMKGWAQDSWRRASLNEFTEALKSMLPKPTPVTELAVPAPAQDSIKSSLAAQLKDAVKSDYPMPLAALKWNPSLETLSSAKLRQKMVKEIQSKSIVSRFVNPSVLAAMKVVPRHLFIEEKLAEQRIVEKNRSIFRRFDFRKSFREPDFLKTAYRYNAPMTGEDAPDILATQLSLAELIPGQSVLLVLARSGYTESVVAQLVGTYGTVTVVEDSEEVLEKCRGRVDKCCPLHRVIRWIHLRQFNLIQMRSMLQRERLSFNTIICMGGIYTHFPTELIPLLKPLGGNTTILASIKTDSAYKYQLLVRRDGRTEKKTISDLDLNFQPRQLSTSN